MPKLSDIHCPVCHAKINGLRAHGNCPKCGVLLSAHYLGIDKDENWIVQPAENDKEGWSRAIRDENNTLIYELPWDQD